MSVFFLLVKRSARILSRLLFHGVIAGNQFRALSIEPVKKPLWLAKVGQIGASLNPTIAGTDAAPGIEEVFSNVVMVIDSLLADGQQARKPA